MAEPTLDEVFSDETGETAAATPAEPEPEVTEPEPEPEVSEPEPEPQETKSREEAGVFQAMLDEREKRQNLERELNALKEAQKPAEPRVDPIDDPEGFQAALDKQVSIAKYELRREMMADRYDDWEEAEAWINAQIPTNAAIAARLQASDNALKDAYAMYQQHKQLEELGDVEAMREKIRDEVKAEVLRELQAEREEQAGKVEKAAKATSKPSLATTGTSGSAGDLGEETLEDVLGSSSVKRRKR